MADCKRILFTVVGSKDPFTSDYPGEHDGPILTLLKFESFGSSSTVGKWIFNDFNALWRQKKRWHYLA
jgi:hypothetical protein